MWFSDYFINIYKDVSLFHKSEIVFLKDTEFSVFYFSSATVLLKYRLMCLWTNIICFTDYFLQLIVLNIALLKCMKTLLCNLLFLLNKYDGSNDYIFTFYISKKLVDIDLKIIN